MAKSREYSPVMREPTEVFVLQANDFSAGVYSTRARAEAEIMIKQREHERERSARTIYYNVYAFVLDAPSRS